MVTGIAAAAETARCILACCLFATGIRVLGAFVDICAQHINEK